jgi:small conductance mechanosensitive channel
VKAASRYKPELKIFAMEEDLKAQNERLSAAKRDTRQAQTQVEILDRRVQRIKTRIAQINDEELPELRDQYYRAIGETIGIRAGKVVAVFAAAWLLVLLTRVLGAPLIERIVKRADKKKGFSADEQQRARTLMTVFMTTARVVVYITAIMFAIAQFDVDYGPLLVAAGGVSLAVGFGAQSLVKDFFSGFFILLEGQFSIGDVVEINGKTGTVENLNLRTTVLRSLTGDVHVIPNGEIAVTTNQTKLWSRMVLDIGVAYEENTDEISGIMEAVAKEMRDDDVWGKKVLEYAMMGVNELGDSAVVIRMLLKTRAGEQWGAGREYRRRLKLKFDELGVEIPWPQRVVSYKGYADMDAKERDQETRKKKAKILRYVRKSRGEMTEEEVALASMSIEERDRAETLAKREVELAKGQEEEKESASEKSAEELKEDAKAADEQMSDAERLAKKMAAEQVEKEKAKAPQDEEKSEDKGEEPPDEKTKPE